MIVYKTLENGMRFVEYEPCFAAGVADMWNKSGDGWGGDSSIRTEQQILLQHSGASFFNVFLALETTGEVVGYCSFDRYYKDADTAYVHVLNVRPDYQGRKVGKELVLLCVQRAIELGYQRLDIHTWAGNTKAVPLYKKCGFLWEDRADSTHLANFIPTVLKTELTAGFFEKADWYTDSSKVIEIKPDGVKVNKFEVFGYSWEKDGGHLAVGFEKTGRRMRLIETDDYRLELIAENHELAFGLDYGCVFTAVNKSGQPLSVKIQGKDDEKIKFAFSAEAQVSGTQEFAGRFTVCEVTEPQDVWRMHPCLLADVWINGKKAEFGLGIEIKFPLNVTLSHRRAAGRPGIVSDVFINIESGLLSDAKIRFTLPENNVSSFACREFTADIPAKGRTMLSTVETTLSEGFAKLDVHYDAVLADGQNVSFTKPLFLVNQGLGGAYPFDTETGFGIINGPWRLTVSKDSNHASLRRYDGTGGADMEAPKLGKPFDDEFNLAIPAEIRRFADPDGYMVMEADYASGKFEGVVLTRRFRISASGLLENSHTVTNRSQSARALWLGYGLWTSVGRRASFRYDGGFIALEDNLAYGFSSIDSEKLQENWIFNDEPDNRAGICWPAHSKPTLDYGDFLSFEHDLGELKPGQSIDIEPIVYACGLFKDARTFRDYVLGTMAQRPPLTQNHVELEANLHNPFVFGEEIDFRLKTSYLNINEGNVSLCSDGLFDEVSADNPAKETVPVNAFTVPVKKTGEAVHIATAKLRLAAYEKDISHVLFMTSGKVTTDEKDGVYSVYNGNLSFCAAPSHSDALYSLKYGAHEWLFSSYPELEPYAWWNPFIGGLQASLPNMSASLTLRERISADFVTEKDTLGNLWTGIKTTVDVGEFDEWRGMTLEQYFLTMPGVPVLCCFCRVINKTGFFKDFKVTASAFYSGKEGLDSYFAEYCDEQNNPYRLRSGKNDEWFDVDTKLVKIIREGSEPRAEKLYFYKNARRDSANMSLSMDINFLSTGAGARFAVESGGVAASLPVFMVLTEKELSMESLSVLDYIEFADRPAEIELP